MSEKTCKESPIVVMGAMGCEYEWLVSQMEGVRESEWGNYRYFEGTLKGVPLVVVNCLAGMVNSALAAARAIERYHPRCVIIQGTAGGHNPELHQYDMVLGENLVFLGGYFSAHRDAGAGSKVENWTFPGTQMRLGKDVKYVNTLHSDERLISIAAGVPYEKGTLVRGTIGTGDVWNREMDMIRGIRGILGTDCEEMEGFSVVQTCNQLGVPALVIRIISNSELHPEEIFTLESGVICQKYCADVIAAIAQN